MASRQCSTKDCPNMLSPNSRMRTCANCRAYFHRWDREKPDKVIGYVYKLRLYRSRLNMFAVVQDDELTKIDHETLEQRKIMSFPLERAKRQAKAIVVAAKLRDRKRKQNAS